MPILNYSTQVRPEQTVAEITTLLVRKGARSITSDYYPDGRVKAVSFVMEVGGYPQRFNLPANVDGVAGVMMRDKPRARTSSVPIDRWKAKVRQQAEWVAWRILKDWVAAQMALIESGQGEAAQVFMPYATADDGRTLFEWFTEDRQRRLGAPQP